MTQTIDGTPVGAAPEHSTADLIKQVTEQTSLLVRDELKLAQLEMTRKGRQAGLGVGLFGGAGLVALFGAGCLIACAIIALSLVIAPWLASLIVGAALLAIAGLAAMMGKSRLSKATPAVPEETVTSLKTDVAEIKERTHR
jgi:hypothetical protein